MCHHLTFQTWLFVLRLLQAVVKKTTLCAACWAHFVCNNQLWATSVNHPFSFLNIYLGLAGGKPENHFHIFWCIFQNFAFCTCHRIPVMTSSKLWPVCSSKHKLQQQFLQDFYYEFKSLLCNGCLVIGISGIMEVVSTSCNWSLLCLELYWTWLASLKLVIEK